MSPRHKRIRKILNIPLMKGFRPYGNQILQEEKRELITLYYEEYEAIRLCDYEGKNHCEASELMQISRPTFTRVYAEARKKIAQAFVEGKQILIEGGKVYFDSDWYHCTGCTCHFNNPDKEREVLVCPLCGKKEFHKVEEKNPGCVKQF